MARGRGWEGGRWVGGEAGVERPRAERVGLHGSLGLGAPVLEPDLHLANIAMDGQDGGGRAKRKNPEEMERWKEMEKFVTVTCVSVSPRSWASEALSSILR